MEKYSVDIIDQDELLHIFDTVKHIVLKSKNKELNISNEIKLSFYKYYKQSIYGNCYTPQPWFYYKLNRAKWDAWNSVKGMSTHEAMIKYISLYNTYKEDL